MTDWRWVVGWLALLYLAQLNAETLTPAQPTRPGAVLRDARQVELTLSDAIYLALRDNRAIRSAYLTRIAQKFDLRVAEERFTPKLVLSATYRVARDQEQQRRQGELTPATTLLTPLGTRVSLGWAYHNELASLGGRHDSDGASIALIQPLLRGAGGDINRAPVRLAQLSEQVNRLNLKAGVGQTVTSTILGYRALLRAQEQVQIARQSLERSRQLLGINRALIAAGRMAEFEVVQTEADVAAQEFSYEQALEQVQLNRLALLQLLALDLQTPLRAVDTLHAERLEVNGAQALLQAQSLQPEYLAQLLGGEQAQINLDVARNNRLWDLSLVGGANQLRDHRGREAIGARRWDHYVGVQVQIPIGDLSARQAEVQAQVEVQNQSIQRAEAHQQLERAVNNAVREIGTRWRQYEIALRALELSARKLDIERQKLTAGRSSNFQVLSFEADLRNAQSTRLDALISYLNAQAELDQTLGTTLQSWDIALND